MYVRCLRNYSALAVTFQNKKVEQEKYRQIDQISAAVKTEL